MADDNKNKFGKYNNPLDLSYFDNPNTNYTTFTYGTGRQDAVDNRDYPNAEARKEAYWKTQNDYSSLGPNDLNGWDRVKYGLGKLANTNFPGSVQALETIEENDRNLARDLAQSHWENQPSSDKFQRNYNNAVMNQKRDVEQKAFDAMMRDKQAYYERQLPNNGNYTETYNDAMKGDARFAAQPQPSVNEQQGPAFMGGDPNAGRNAYRQQQAEKHANNTNNTNNNPTPNAMQGDSRYIGNAQ